MGTYHIIDVKVASSCQEETFVRNWAAGGGVKVFLSVHTKKVWSEVGSVPVTSWTTEEDVQQAVKDAPVLGNSMLPTTIERLRV